MRRDGTATTSLGSRLLDEAGESHETRRKRTIMLLVVSLAIPNIVGVAVSIPLTSFVLPGPDIYTSDFLLIDFVAVPLLIVFACVFAGIFIAVASVRTLGWEESEDPPTTEDVRGMFALPWQLTRVQGALWIVVVGVSALLYGLVDPRTIGRILLGGTLSAILVCTVAYLLTDFALRPAAAYVLQQIPLQERQQGVAGLSLLYWLLATALPLFSLIVVIIEALASDSVSKQRLAVCALTLVSINLVASLCVTYLTVRSVTVPIGGLRSAMKQIGRADYAARVAVYNNTEIGELQSGFNVMARGLQEREEIREIFGRHVGKDVARAALAATRAPSEVVSLLNRLFDVVVAEIDRHRGFINKFESDGALAVFGAPTHLDDPAGSVLQAARAIDHRLRDEVPECQASIGVSYGTAVAGNIGSAQRFKYTVIGDPVNEASRLCELAKTTPGRVLASDTAIAAARGTVEAALWTLGDEIVLRGRTSPTRLASPNAHRSRAEL